MNGHLCKQEIRYFTSQRYWAVFWTCYKMDSFANLSSIQSEWPGGLWKRFLREEVKGQARLARARGSIPIVKEMEARRDRTMEVVVMIPDTISSTNCKLQPMSGLLEHSIIIFTSVPCSYAFPTSPPHNSCPQTLLPSQGWEQFTFFRKIHFI